MNNLIMYLSRSHNGHNEMIKLEGTLQKQSLIEEENSLAVRLSTK